MLIRFAVTLCCALLAGCPAVPTVIPKGRCPVPLHAAPGQAERSLCRVDSYNAMVRCSQMRGIQRPHTIAALQAFVQKAAAEKVPVSAEAQGTLWAHGRLNAARLALGFGSERTAIVQAKKLYGGGEWALLAGLVLSGGGVRSASFGTGVLLGLHGAASSSGSAI
jgi:hypothetical protein